MNQKNSFFKYTIFTFVLIFSFFMKIDAKVCNYYLGNSNTKVLEGDAYFEDYVKYYKYMLTKTGRDLHVDSVYLKPSYNDVLNASIAADGVRDLFDAEYRYWGDNYIRVAFGDPAFYISNFRATYDTETQEVRFYVTAYTRLAANTDKWMQSKNSGVKYTFDTEWEDCPEVFMYGLSYWDNSIWNFSPDEKMLIIYDLDIDNVEEDIAKNLTTSTPIFLFADSDIGGYNYSDYYHGKVCQLRNYDDNFKVINDVDSIIKSFDDSGFNYKKLYQKYEELEKKFKSGNLDKTTDEIIDSLLSSDPSLLEEIIDLPYFSSNLEKWEIQNKIRSDFNTFATYQNVVNNCFFSNFDLDGSKEYIYSWHEKYDSSSNYKYIDFLAQLILKIDDKIEKDDFLSTIKDLEISASINDVVNSNVGCNNAGSKAEICRTTECRKLLDSVDCNEFLSKTLDELDSEVDKNIFERANSSCSGESYKDCFLSRCSSLKSEFKDQCGDVITGNTEAHQEVKEIFTTVMTDVIKTTGINIETESSLCEWLYDKEDGLGGYIDFIINLIRIGGPVLIIVLTCFDGIKAVASFKDDENKKFFNRLKIRLICLILLFLIPTIIKFIIDLFVQNVCMDGVIVE